MGSEKQEIDINAVAASKGMTAEEYRKILLAEYEEIGKCWRHDDNIARRFDMIIIPGCLAAMYFASQNWTSVFLAGIPAVVLIWVSRLFRRMKVRWCRAHAIEKSLSMNHHIAVDGAKDKGITIRTLLTTFSILVTLYWLVLVLLGSDVTGRG